MQSTLFHRLTDEPVLGLVQRRLAWTSAGPTPIIEESFWQADKGYEIIFIKYPNIVA
jgi:hypothetical protein